MTEQGQRPDLPARPAGGDAEDDAAVIRRSHDEPEHFAVLFRRYAPGVQRYVRRRLGVSAARACSSGASASDASWRATAWWWARA